MGMGKKAIMDKDGIEKVVEALAHGFAKTALSHNPYAENAFNLEQRLKFNVGEVFEKNGQKFGLAPAAMVEAWEAATSIIPEYISVIDKLKKEKEKYSTGGFWQSVAFGLGISTGGSGAIASYYQFKGLPIPHIQHPDLAIGATLIAAVLLGAAYGLYDATTRNSTDALLNGLPRHARGAYSTAVNILFYRIISSYHSVLHSMART